MQCPSKCPKCGELCRGVDDHEPPFHGDDNHLWIMHGHEKEVRIPVVKVGGSIVQDRLGQGLVIPEVIGEWPEAYLYWNRKEDTFDSALELAASMVENEAERWVGTQSLESSYLMSIAAKIRQAKQAETMMDYHPCVGTDSGPSIPPILNPDFVLLQTDDELIERASDVDLGIQPE